MQVTFPADYKAVVTEHQGQTATPAIFKFFSADSEAYDATSLSTLFHFVPEDADRAQYHVVAMHDLLKDRLPEGVIPIGDDPGKTHTTTHHHDDPLPLSGSCAALLR